jgi:hypothetical protein
MECGPEAQHPRPQVGPYPSLAILVRTALISSQKYRRLLYQLPCPDAYDPSFTANWETTILLKEK